MKKQLVIGGIYQIRSASHTEDFNYISAFSHVYNNDVIIIKTSNAPFIQVRILIGRYAGENIMLIASRWKFKQIKL